MYSQQEKIMNLNKILEQIEVPDEVIHNLKDELDKHYLVPRLLESRERMIDDYEAVKNGSNRSIFVLNDPEEDAFQISRRIEAYDLVLAEFLPASELEPYDFNDEHLDD
jgi:hypothetical protein